MSALSADLRANSARVLREMGKVKIAIQDENTRAKANLKQEAKYWTKFKEIVGDKDHFTIDDVDTLCSEFALEYDILFILGKKNVGKTRQIYKLFNDALKAKKKVIYGRMSQTELQGCFNDFNTDTHNPLEMKNTHGTTMLIDRANSSTVCGKAVDFKFCQKVGGGEYADYSKIIFDEVISYDPRNTLNANHMRNWAAFLSSIVRDKVGVKAYLFGNLLDNSNLDLLDFYQLNQSDNLRYIIRNPSNPCKILFINLRDLYKGIESQAGGVQHMSPAYAAALKTNSPTTASDKIIGDKEWAQFAPWHAFVWFTGEAYILVQVNKAKQEPKCPIAIKISMFKLYDALEIDILTDDSFLCMQYPNLNYIHSLDFLYEEIYYKTRWKNIYFFSAMALMHTQRIYNSIVDSIESKQLGRAPKPF